MKTLVENAVQEITRLHGEVMQSARTTLDKAIRIGELLTNEKAKLNHGEWLPWLKANVPFHQTMVSRYIVCYLDRDKLRATLNFGIGIEAAVKLLRDHNAKPRGSPVSQSTNGAAHPESVSVTRPVISTKEVEAVESEVEEQITDKEVPLTNAEKRQVVRVRNYARKLGFKRKLELWLRVKTACGAEDQPRLIHRMEIKNPPDGPPFTVVTEFLLPRNDREGIIPRMGILLEAPDELSS